MDIALLVARGLRGCEDFQDLADCLDDREERIRDAEAEVDFKAVEDVISERGSPLKAK